MNVDVYHNGDIVTEHVISYEREHQICTGVGQLTIVFDGLIGRTFNPWDSIDIYENGSFKVRYFVSNHSRSAPTGTIILQCQDMSKKLVDYFIPDQYTVEGPTYTRFWIEKFLDEAGISYSFLTASNGNLLSNMTTLGLTSGYDQIITLLQLSGWYMYFNGSGTAVIGSLNTNLAQKAGMYTETDILDISVVSHDKMLRNRAVVWGAFDALTQRHTFADVSVRTKWNYDAKDKRAVVISNSNIPNMRSAYEMANQLLKEFAKITVEKHITVTGARNVNLGQMVGISSRVFNGGGMITTFGVSMSSGGLVTKLVLDERCPRLFGFFNFGDYVYISTFGAGVWRKHIQFDHTWYDFSSGITDLNIVDLHIKDGIYGAVGSSGMPFYANSENGPWNEIQIDSLPSSQDDTITSSGVVNYVPFSGIYAKAVIVDKNINTIKYGVSTGSGISYGDYFMDYSASLSGILESGNMRSWIVEYNPYTGQSTGGLGSGIYPIHYSGIYSISVLDIENDGISDYVSVSMGSNVYSGGYNFGSFSTNPITVRDYNNTVSFTYSGYGLEGETLYTDYTGVFVAVLNDEPNDERDILNYVQTGGNTFANIEHFFKTYSISLGRNRVVSQSIQSPAISGTNLMTPITGCKVSPGIYRIFGYKSTVVGFSSISYDIKYIQWNRNNNTISGPTSIATIAVQKDIDPEVDGVEEFIDILHNVVNGNIYFYSTHQRRWYYTLGTPAYPSPNFIKFERLSINMQTLATNSISGTKDLETGGVIGGVGTDGWNSYSPTVSEQVPTIVFQSGTESKLVCMIGERNKIDDSTSTAFNNWFLVMDSTGLTSTKVQETSSGSSSEFVYRTGHSGDVTVSVTNQLNENHCMYIVLCRGNDAYFKYNGDEYTTGIDATIDDVGTVKTLNGGSGSTYLTKRGSNWFIASSSTFEDIIQISFPLGYTIINPFITMEGRRDCVFWLATRTIDSKRVILILGSGGLLKSVIVPFFASLWLIPGFTTGFVAGNFFLNNPSTSRSVLYVDNIYPSASYMVLQREDMEYNLIQEDEAPIRLDISNYAPLLTVTSGEGDFVTSYISDTFVDQIILTSGEGRVVEDYRYTYLESPLSDIDVSTSGVGIQTMGVYVVGSGIFGQDISTYSGGFQELYTIPSGYGNRIETSNYGLAGQYMFVTTSGESPTFYQKDPTDIFFVEYSGIPNYRVTRIRLDDRL